MLGHCFGQCCPDKRLVDLHFEASHRDANRICLDNGGVSLKAIFDLGCYEYGLGEAPD